MMAKINLILTTENRFWFKPAFLVLTLICTLLGVVSKRLAGAVADAGARLIARYAVRYRVMSE